VNKPRTDRQWAMLCARLFKTIKPCRHGGRGLSDHREFEAAFEGGWPDRPANSDAVAEHLRAMVRSDLNLARAVVLHDVADGSGIVRLADHARTALADAIAGIKP
jgi:hypothetical protein